MTTPTLGGGGSFLSLLPSSVMNTGLSCKVRGHVPETSECVPVNPGMYVPLVNKGSYTGGAEDVVKIGHGVQHPPICTKRQMYPRTHHIKLRLLEN